MAYRDDILKAVYEAERLHREFDTKARAEEGEGRIDVFGMLVKRDIPVMFRPLKNLLGAYIDDPDQGVIVTTQRPLPVQRFTAAHELGHAALGHEASLDEEDILTRAHFVTEANYDAREIQLWSKAGSSSTEAVTKANYDIREIQANAFAIRTSIAALADRPTHEATRLDAREPDRSDHRVPARAPDGVELRSDLLCPRRQQGHRPADVREAAEGQAQDHQASPRQAIRAGELVRGRVAGHGAGQRNGAGGQPVRPGGTQDSTSTPARATSGSSATSQTRALRSGRTAAAASSSKQHIGGVVFRTVIAEPLNEGGASGHVQLREVRPWQAAGELLHSLELDFGLSGPVPAGLLPAQREALLGVA